ncbi:Protein of unknown function [Gryllus bimaculatus]|nr:Protein of unknown function [Gryllus bimaculatus]
MARRAAGGGSAACPLPPLVARGAQRFFASSAPRSDDAAEALAAAPALRLRKRTLAMAHARLQANPAPGAAAAAAAAFAQAGPTRRKDAALLLLLVSLAALFKGTGNPWSTFLVGCGVFYFIR